MSLKLGRNTWAHFGAGVRSSCGSDRWSLSTTLAPTSNQTIKRNLSRPSKKVTKLKEKAIDLSGDYDSNDGMKPNPIEKKSQAWKIDYQTADGRCLLNLAYGLEAIKGSQ